MSSPLERGNRPDIKKINYSLLYRISKPLIKNAFIGYSSGVTLVNGLYQSDGSALPNQLLKVECNNDDSGFILLTYENGNRTAIFTYKSIASGPRIIEGEVDVFRNEGLGIGTSMLHAGLLLMERIGPQLNYDIVFGFVSDTASPMRPQTTSSRNLWTSAAINGFGYTSDAKLFQEADLDQQDYAFLKRLK